MKTPYESCIHTSVATGEWWQFTKVIQFTQVIHIFHLYHASDIVFMSFYLFCWMSSLLLITLFNVFHVHKCQQIIFEYVYFSND